MKNKRKQRPNGKAPNKKLDMGGVPLAGNTPRADRKSPQKHKIQHKNRKVDKPRRGNYNQQSVRYAIQQACRHEMQKPKQNAPNGKTGRKNTNNSATAQCGR